MSQFRFECAAIGEFEKAQPFVVSDRKHCSQRRIDSFREHAVARFRGGRRIAKDASERFAKTAGRFETAPVLGFIDATALPHLAQGEAHSSSPMISLEGHS